ncbi:AAA family ATPase [uncultured Clostridium sp.]|uniref:AAA family ATPase n=1 Tax=uncultured Clostridium sp. TaxID=59620 RepID=UPI003218068E
MKRVLKPSEVLYDFEIVEDREIEGEFILPQYKDVYNRIKTSLLLNGEGYNIYLVDEFCKDRVKHITSYVKHILMDGKPPKDICYVIKGNAKEPVPLFVNNGYGNKLKKIVDKIQEFYAESIFKFYNGIDNKEKEYLISAIKDRRSKIVGDLINLSREHGFDIKTSGEGFTFIPLVDGKEMTEDEFDDLKEEEKFDILNKVDELKISANDILEKLRNMKNDEINRIREIMDNFFKEEMKELNIVVEEEFKDDSEAKAYIHYLITEIKGELEENYSINYEDDEEGIRDIIYKYDVNVIVDNSEVTYPPVIFEEDPSVSNLFGSIDYENHNNIYVSTVKSIRAGSYVRANGGCLVLRASSLLSNSQSYYYLKRAIISEKVDLDYNRGYIELFTLSSLKPVPMPINTKVIIIGDYDIYDALYNYDKEFRTIFKTRADYRGILKAENKVKTVLLKEINRLAEKNNVKPITSSGIREVAKFLSRKAENKNKIYFDHDELSNLIIQANYRAVEESREFIDGDDIEKIAYRKETIEREYLELYDEKKLLIDVTGSKVGQINGLSVIDTGYTSFGKPVKITCTCFKGEGKVIDAQRESNLSGKIHTKGINILKGYINNINGGYKTLPVDFNLSFEQLYGVIDGDSASVAEALAIISALCKIPIKQNIAITGSINQFGQVQPIGGVNEKIEGFFEVCKIMDDIEGKGVIIPLSNKDNLVLSREVERAIFEGKFKICTMETVEDAMELIFDAGEISMDNIMDLISKQCMEYEKK